MRTSKTIILMAVLCFNSVVVAKPLSSIILNNPDQCIEEQDWDRLERVLGYQLSQVKFLYPESSKFNLNVTAHGNLVPENPAAIKTVRLDEYFASLNDSSQGALIYGVTGQHGELFNPLNKQLEFSCVINIDLPIDLKKQLIYQLNGRPSLLTDAFAEAFDLVGVVATHIAIDVFEICYVGYWSTYFSEEIKSFEALKNHEGYIDKTKEMLREKILLNQPELENNEGLLEQKVQEMFDNLLKDSQENFNFS